MPIVLATEKDLMDVMFLLRKCVADMNHKQMFHWNRAYPSVNDILDDIRSESLYIHTENSICQGMVVLNESPPEEYGRIGWENRTGRVLIVHRLAVHPVFQGKGIGKKLIGFAVSRAGDLGYSAIRLDVIESNRPANELYLGMGFHRAGTFHFPFQKSPFVCYELSLGR